MRAPLLCAALIVLAAPAAAFAEAPDQATTSVAVHFGDLNLESARGARQMLDRISQAALDACGAPRESLQDYRYAVRRSSCYREGVADAVASLNAPEVTRLYNGRNQISVTSRSGS